MVCLSWPQKPKWPQKPQVGVTPTLHYFWRKFQDASNELSSVKFGPLGVSKVHRQCRFGIKNTSLQFLKLRINVNQKPFVFSAGLWNAAGQQKCAGLSRVPRDFVVPHSRDFQSRSRYLAGLSRENESRSRVGWGKWVPVPVPRPGTAVPGRKSRGISVPSPIPGFEWEKHQWENQDLLKSRSGGT